VYWRVASVTNISDINTSATFTAGLPIGGSGLTAVNLTPASTSGEIEYWVYFTKNGICCHSDTVPVVITVTLNVDITVPDSPINNLCEGDTINLGTYVVANLPVTYYEGAVGDANIIPDPANYPLGSAPVTIYVKAGTGNCEDTKSFTINPNPKPIVPPITMELDCNFKLGIGTVTISPVDPLYQYSLNDVYYGTDGIFTGVETGSYTLYVRTSSGCVATGGTIEVDCDCGYVEPPKIKGRMNRGN
jgi:hypothetical protein